MPNYDYRCRGCGSEFEKNVPMEDRNNTGQCDCGGETYRIMTFFGSVYAPTAGGMR